MIIRVLLTMLLLVIAWVAIASHKEHRGLSKLAIAVSLSGIAAIWLDQHVVVVAQWLGVGRGTDLVLYITWPIMFFGLLMLFVRIRRTEARLTDLARSIALGQAKDIRVDESKL